MSANMTKGEFLNQKKANFRNYLLECSDEAARFASELNKYMSSDTLFYNLIKNTVRPYVDANDTMNAVHDFMSSHNIPPHALTDEQKQKVCKYLELFVKIIIS